MATTIQIHRYWLSSILDWADCSSQIQNACKRFLPHLFRKQFVNLAGQCGLIDMLEIRNTLVCKVGTQLGALGLNWSCIIPLGYSVARLNPSPVVVHQTYGHDVYTHGYKDDVHGIVVLQVHTELPRSMQMYCYIE